MEWMEKEVKYLSGLELEAVRRLQRAAEARIKEMEAEEAALREYESVRCCRMEWERQIKELEASDSQLDSI
jgi:hypothetical protein